jgi:hypothetical protein
MILSREEQEPIQLPAVVSPQWHAGVLRKILRAADRLTVLLTPPGHPQLAKRCETGDGG